MPKCPQCHAENRARATFCRACGARLVIVCPQCKRVLPLETLFCDACGARVLSPPATPTAEPEASALAAAIQRHVPKEFAERLRASRGQVGQERRMVTILFSDIKGYSTIASALDPEEVMDIVNGAFEFLIGPIYRHEGTLAQLMGDAILAFFGAPIAHEDDPERAISAGLEIQQAARDYAAHLERERRITGFKVRVGINTGLVVVGEVGSDLRVTYTAVGDAINMAARMEQNAPEGGVLISQDTYRLVRGAFDVQAMPPLTVKGRREPMQTYLVQRAKPRRFRMPARGVEGVATRLIGREVELRRLQDALTTTIQEGEGQVMTIVGEAGVGKSRLVDEFQNWMELLPDQVRLFRARGHPETQSQPYALLRDLFAFRFQIQDNDPLEAVRRKLENGFADALGAAEPGPAHIIGQLLGFDFSASPYLKGLVADPQALRNRGMAELMQYFQTVSTQAPAVLLLEDIHWADDASLDLVNHLGRGTAQARLLIVCLARPALFERRPYWGEGQAYHSRLDLHPLSRQHSRQLVAEILQRVDGVPVALRDLVVEGAEGNPFYIEELIKMLIERGVIVAGEEQWSVQAERLATLDVPPSLTAVLQARLDALPLGEKSVLQEASVVGRVFWDTVVAHIHEAAHAAGKADVTDALGALRSREMVFRREQSAFAGAQEYIFKHAILRDVTYESVLKRLRRTYHGAAADWLIAHSGDRTEEYSGLIAEHLEGAGQGARAVGYLRQAGEQAAARYANAEGITYLTRALDLTVQTNLDERFALLLLREQLCGYQGLREPQRQDLDSLAALAEALGDQSKQARVLLRQARLAEQTNDYPAQVACGQAAADLGRAAGDSTLEAEGRLWWGRGLWRQGAYQVAEEQVGQALPLARASGLVDLEADILRALGALSLAQGRAAEGQGYSEQSLVLYQATGNRQGEAHIWNNLGITALASGDWHLALRRYEQGLRLVRRIADLPRQLHIMSNIGELLWSMGASEQAEAQATETLALARTYGDRLVEALQLRTLGLVAFGRGDRAGGLAKAAQALAIAQEIGAPYDEAMCRTALGRLLADGGQGAEAAPMYRAAADIHASLSQHALAAEPLAGLAELALGRGDLVEANAQVEQILPQLSSPTVLSVLEPLRISLICYRVLQATGDCRAEQVLQAAHTRLQDLAAKIQDEDLRRPFLQVPVNQEIAAAFETMTSERSA